MGETQTMPKSSPPPSEKIFDQKDLGQQLIMQFNIARVLAESNSIDNAATQVLQMICETAGWDFGALWKVEAETHVLANEGVWYGARINLSKFAEGAHYNMIEGDKVSLPGHVLQTRQPVWISNLEKYESIDAVEAIKAGLHSAFILPIHSGGKMIAVLVCMSTGNRYQDQRVIDLLCAVGNQIGVFLERKQLEEALLVRANQQQLLAQVGVALTTSIDYEERLLNLVHVIVPKFADWCAIDVLDKNNLLRRIAAAHVDPAKERLVYDIQPTRVVVYAQPATPQVDALLSGQSLLFTEIPLSLIEQTIHDRDELEMLRRLDPKSSIVVPLIAHGRTFGLCTFVESDSGRRYLPNDLIFAEDIGRRVSVAVDNALLYAETISNNIELERRVEDRTSQLRVAISQLTNQMEERQQIEENVKTLNSELEQRIAERTSQLEVAIRKLEQEVSNHRHASQALRTSFKRMRELYRISQIIGTVREPNELLDVLLTSTYLKDTSRASIAILDEPWVDAENAPKTGFILAEWNKGKRQPRYINQHLTMEELGLFPPVSFGEPIMIQDIQSISSLSERVRKRFSALRTHSLIILPLVAGGEWYGLLSLHFKSRRMPNTDDLRHIRGLVNETAIAIKNLRLLETESQARREAEAANDLKLKFLAMISHELRTPLASIKGFATTLLADDIIWPPEKVRDFLETINLESDKLSELIDQLLDLSRIEAGILRVVPKKQSLKNITSALLPQLKEITREHELVVNIPPDLPDIFGDEHPIAQVLINLVGNAAKYSPSKTLITISGRPAGRMIQIDVADKGIGIPLQERKHIFEPFYQLNNGSPVYMRGAGLGLAICKGLVEAHGGKIWIQDQPGPGTVISFTLPIEKGVRGIDRKNEPGN